MHSDVDGPRQCRSKRRTPQKETLKAAPYWWDLENTAGYTVRHRGYRGHSSNNLLVEYTFKNCESSCCAPVYNIVHQLYFNFLQSPNRI